MKGIFLDDERVVSDVTWVKYNRVIDWYVVDNAAEFVFIVSHLGKSISDYAFSFDHDIQSYHPTTGIEFTGYDCLKSLVDYCLNNDYTIPSEVFFHTKNPVGNDNMITYYHNAVKHQMSERGLL